MKAKIFCMMVLCTCLFIACDKDNDDYEPVKPPIEQPEEPEEPEIPVEPDKPAIPSTDDIINAKIGDLNMIVGSEQWNAITYGNGRYVAVGNNGHFAYSTDGSNWTSGKFGTVSYIRLVYYPDAGFLAIGGSAYNGTIIRSTDGSDWELFKSPIGSNGSPYGIAYGNGTYCLVGNNGQVFTSSDLKQWKKSSNYNATRIDFSDIAYGNGKFVGIGMLNASEELLYSTDGLEWNFITGYASGQRIKFEANRFIAYLGSYDIYYSEEGSTNWTELLHKSSFRIRDVTTIEGTLIALSTTGYVSSSVDWTTFSEPQQIKDETGQVVLEPMKAICAVRN